MAGRKVSDSDLDFTTLPRFFKNKEPSGNGTIEEDTDDALTADFRARLGLLSEEDEGLSDAFKAHLGLQGLDEVFEQAEITIANDWEKDATVASFKFSKFAKNHFQGGATPEFTKEPLRVCLLPKKHEVDRLASVCVWLAIQRFMGDAPQGKSDAPRELIPVMTKIYRTIETYNHRESRVPSSRENDDVRKNERKSSDAQKAEFEPFKMRKRSSVKKLLGMMGSHSDKQTEKTKEKAKEKRERDRQKDELIFGAIDDLYCDTPELILEKLPNDSLDLIHFIVGHGILRRGMRDEILCQLCKQLTNNPSKKSLEKGYMLLGFCVGCFLPSETFIMYLKCFMNDAPLDVKDTYVPWAKKLLRRTIVNGTRYHPPNYLEYQATLQRKYVMIPVTFSDSRTEMVETDAASTASEICQALANKIGLKDHFGFSLYISIFDKVSSLGSGLDHVMDAISECEQVVRANGQKEEDAPWRLFFRKELFSPWHDPTYDDVSTNLIYTQFRKGLRCKEYKFKNDEEIGELTARIYFVECEGQIIPGKLQQSLHHYLPTKVLSQPGARDTWTALIISNIEKLKLEQGKQSIQKIKENLVMTAAEKWVIQFSGLFEAFRISGPPLPRNDVVVAINHRGVYVMHEPFKVCLAIYYYQIIEVFSSRTTKQRGQSFSIATIMGDEYTFMSPNAQNIASLVSIFLEGLRRRSKYAVGIQEFHIDAAGSPFMFRKGDLLVMLETEPVGAPPKETREKQEWVYGVNDTNKLCGPFPLDMCYILPTMEKPPLDVLNYFAVMSIAEAATLPRRKGNVKLATMSNTNKKGGKVESAA